MLSSRSGKAEAAAVTGMDAYRRVTLAVVTQALAGDFFVGFSDVNAGFVLAAEMSEQATKIGGVVLALVKKF
jgi:hypothetical protein